MGKVPIDVQMLSDLRTLAQRNNTLDKFSLLAVEWAEQATEALRELEAERDRYKGTLNAIVFCAMDYPEAVSMASEALGLEGDVEEPQP